MEQTRRVVGHGSPENPTPRATFSTRVVASSLSALVLSACVSTVPTELDFVEVDAKKISLERSTFSAQAVADGVSISHVFATPLDPRLASATRLESSITHEVSDGGEQLRIGDAVSSVGMWGTPVRFGGVQFGKTSPREHVLLLPELATSGVAVLPTAADALFASLDPDSPLRAHSLSVDYSVRAFTGTKVGLTARDALGRSQQISAPIIEPVRLVKEGCEDFSIGLGRVRRDYAIESNDYGPLFANTTVACSTPLGLTIEGHGEYLADEVAALGFGLAHKLGSFGIASVAFASSQSEFGAGWLARVGFEHSNPWFSIALRSRLQSREFREINSLAVSDPIMHRDLASIGIRVAEWASLSLAYATQTTWSRERASLIAVRQDVSVGRGSLSLSAGHSPTENIGSSLFISYRRPFGTESRDTSKIRELDLESLARPLTLTE
jgi:hypothetical protein